MNQASAFVVGFVSLVISTALAEASITIKVAEVQNGVLSSREVRQLPMPL